MANDLVALKSAPTSAAAVANTFLEFAEHEPAVPPVDPMKLQKLLFYAHAWYLANEDAPLFDEKFEAWPWGPVLRSVYVETLKFGSRPVRGRVTELDVTGDGPLDLITITPRISDQDLLAFLKEVWDAHKGLTGIQLSNATHAEGEPWTLVKNEYGDLGKKPKIPNELIQAVFKKKLEHGEAESSAAA